MSFFTGIIGIIDILAAGALLAIYYDNPILHLQAGMALALVAKGVFFLPEILSILDIIIGIALFSFFWIDAPTTALVMAVWLLYKGVYAWF